MKSADYWMRESRESSESMWWRNKSDNKERWQQQIQRQIFAMRELQSAIAMIRWSSWLSWLSWLPSAMVHLIMFCFNQMLINYNTFQTII